MMKYKGYLGVVKFDDEAGVLRGQVADLKDMITFQGASVEDVRQAFQDSVDDYLEFCSGRNEEPERPFSGKLLIRIKPALHRSLSALALERGISVNRLIAAHLKKAIQKVGTVKSIQPVEPPKG